MSKKEKLIKRLKSKPTDFTYNEARTLLMSLGFKEEQKGRTSGSRVAFINVNKKISIELHRPHPNSVLKKYQINILIEKLKKWGEYNE